ncbi:MAG TPA: tyrosine-type recombinase/integrase [Acidimicrobiales bacterium]|nr:tyrosine-type recombinase/integrase [Acidimicrobiales bacterium]
MSDSGRSPDGAALSAVASEWLRTKQLARRSPASDAARRGDLTVIAAQLADYLGRPDGDEALGPMERQLARLGLGDLEPRALREAFADYAAGHAASSVRRVLSTWRGFCGWLRAEGHLLADPLAGLQGPGRADWKPKPLELVELARVIEAAATPDPRARHPWPERDRALVAVFTGAGVRIGEAIALRVDDVEARDRAPRLRLYGKGGRRRVVPVGREVVEAVDAYLETRLARLGRYSPTDPLFVRADGRPFTRGTMDYLVAGWFRRAGVAPPPGSLAHALRHTYATLLVDTGASLPEVQRLLGHRDLSTTQVYLGVTGSGLEAAALSNPARRLLEAVARRTEGG